MYICVCNSVTDKQILEAAEAGASTLQDLSDELKVATCCGRCATCANKLLREAHSKTAVYEQPLIMMNAATTFA
ncbi:MAG: (2Fe-2S)-binding protein [Gammaproteobacteria bacterium]